MINSGENEPASYLAFSPDTLLNKGLVQSTPNGSPVALSELISKLPSTEHIRSHSKQLTVIEPKDFIRFGTRPHGHNMDSLYVMRSVKTWLHAYSPINSM